MKRILGLIIITLIIYVIYYDLSKGTLSFVQADIEQNERTIKSDPGMDYFEKEVEGGDTLLSIIEEDLNRSIPVSIEEVIEDFKHLNNDLKPQEIQFGETYKFPDYRSFLEE